MQGETYEIDGLTLHVPSVQMGKGVRKALREGRYEHSERALAKACLRPGDRVLELGAGLGLTAMLAAQIVGPESVTAVEANPNTIPVIRENFALNGMEGIRLIHGAVVPQDMDGSPVELNLAGEFWGSSLIENEARKQRQVSVPGLGFTRLIEESNASVVTMDVEGTEIVLFDDPLPESVRGLVIEIHPAIYGRDALAPMQRAIAASGLRKRRDHAPVGVWLMERPDAENAHGFAPPKQGFLKGMFGG